MKSPTRPWQPGARRGPLNTRHQGLVAKILKHPEADDRRARVETLIAHPLRGDGRWRFAAPEDLLLDRAAGQFAGYTMPLVSNADALDEFFDPGGTRYRRDPAFRVGLAIAVAEMVSEMHRNALDIVICDLKPQNILADDHGNVTLIDIDSVQMTTIRGTTYLSSAWSNFYLAAELNGKDLRRQRREQTADLFALAVIIFQILMGGWHPCASAGQADLADQIRRGTFPHVAGAGSPDRPPPKAPPFGALPEELRHLFTQMFVDGFWDAGLRPTADEWVKALKQNTKALTRRPQVFTPPAAQTPAAAEPRRKFRRAVAAVAAALVTAVVPSLFPAGWWRLGGADVATLAALRPTFRRPRSTVRHLPRSTICEACRATRGAAPRPLLIGGGSGMGRASRLASRVPIRRESHERENTCVVFSTVTR